MSLESIWNGTVKTMIGLGVASLVGLTGMTINYYRTHDEVRKTCIEDQCEYRHPDKETTHILNYIAGKEAMGKEERLELLTSALTGYCKSLEIEPPDFSTMNEREAIEYMRKISPPQKYEIHETVDEAIKSMNDLLPLKREYNPELYMALWQMENEFGAPYVKWASTRREEESSLGNKLSNSRYNALTNTLQIWPIEPLDTLVAEFTHAQQFNNETIIHYFRYVDDLLRVAGKAATGIPFVEAYNQEYDTRGTTEYEAHKIIEPQLRERLKKIIDLEGK